MRGAVWRDGLLDAVARTRTLDVLQRASGQACIVLLYHSVATGEDNPYLDARSFAEQMNMLAAEFHVLSGDEYLWHLDRGLRLPRRSVLVTFDDGFRNNALVVQPIMQRHGLPWVLFTTTQLLDDPGRPLWSVALRAACLFTPEIRARLMGVEWDLGDKPTRLDVYRRLVALLESDPLPSKLSEVRSWAYERWGCVPREYAERFGAMLSVEELRDLAASPLVEIGCHTRTHPFLVTVPDQLLDREIDHSSAALGTLLGRRIRMFAYPAGAYGEREISRVVKAGFSCAFAVVPTVGRAPRFEIARVGVYHPSTALARAKALGLGNVLRSVGIAVG